ncbi:MAG: TonB-dependent receptor [Rhodanobacteraceae bacterium]|nr:TonB-dependent receptor [Rhodanobacteraceae bacterium]MBL0042544.1 TonB-dependent receptor [Xanthomonadales bacterium]MBP6077208.1 TonB-dependent receptor [Xanthomonadales bacterium]MBP7624802.1 TonB-dependent receptor [Xanthomonadales bacterium]
MSKHIRSPLALAIAFSLFAALPVLAQDEKKDADEAKSDKTATMEQITVTARRREETLQEVPVAVTAFTETALENLNVQDMGDLDAQVPNLTVYAARGSNSTVTAYIRGVGQSDPLWGVDPGVGVYLDDVYIARPQGALLDVIDIDRVEVLRGPQGTLYGKNTIGGAIKYVTKVLTPDFGSTTSVAVGSHSQLDVKTSLNLPLGSDAVVGRISLASLNRDGFGENRRTGAPVSDKEILVARGTLGFYPSDAVSVVLSADWLDDQGGVRGAQRLNAFNPADPTHTPPLNDRYDVLNGMSNVNDTAMDGASATINWNLADGWWFKSVTAYRQSDTDTSIDFDTLPNKIADVRALYSDEQLSQEFQFNYASDNWSGVFGAFWFDGEAGGTVYNNFFNVQFGTTNGTVDTESVALYGEGTFPISDTLSVTAGLRWTDETKSADVLNQFFSNAQFTTVIATPSDFTDSVDFKNLSPKVSLDWQLDDDTLVYGLISRGFKSGGFNIRANATAVPASALPFDDESVTSFEIGTKKSFNDDSLFLNAALFHNKYEDIQLSVFSAYDSNGDGTDDSFFGDFTNAGQATVQGLELELQWLATDRLSISGNAAWLDAAYDEFVSRGTDIADSQYMTNAPKRSGALTLAYTWPAFGGELMARATTSYQSKVYPTTDLSEVIAQSGYSLFNAGLVWRGEGPWSFSLQGSNLGDKEYRTTGYNIPVLGILTGFYGAPRQYTLAATYSFD